MARLSRLVITGGLVLLVLVVGAYALLTSRGDDQPPPVTLPPVTTAAGAPGAAGSGTADGTWTVQRGGAGGQGSFVGYRVREKLAFLSAPNDAVGRTPAVGGTVTVAGRRVTAAKVEVDLRELASDNPRRDGAIRSNGLESDRFPSATFVLTGPVELDAEPVAGKGVGGDAAGNLTLHGVTRPVTVPLKGRWDGDRLSVAGAVPVSLREFRIEAPTIGPVVSIEDRATVEIQLALRRG